MANKLKNLHHQLREAKENLALIEGRTSEYVLSTDIPLQLIKERQQLEKHIRRLERRIDELRPIHVLRKATKLITGPVARTLTGEPWGTLRQRLLTQASRLPRDTHLDTTLMEEALDDMIRLNREVKILLEAYRIEPNPGQLEVLQRRAGRLVDYLIRIYRLEASDTPDLQALVAGTL
jgi:hypothetical protein